MKVLIADDTAVIRDRIREILAHTNNLASGIYLYRVTSGDFNKTMKMNLIK